MADANIRPGSTARLGLVEGELRVGRGARIEANGSGGKVRVTGGAHFDGDAEIACAQFECESLTVGSERRLGPSGKLRFAGDLLVHTRLDVGHSVEARGSIAAQEIDVGGRIRARSVTCKNARVGGIVEATEGFEADSAEVGGKFIVLGSVKLKDLGVSGVAEVGGGSIAGRAEVRGKFSSDRRLEFGEMRVLGKCDLAPRSKGEKISTSGKLTARGELECKSIQVMGVTQVLGDCASERVEVNGRFVVSGSLSVSSSVESMGSMEVSGDVGGTNLRTGGRLEAKSVVMSGEADLVGHVATRRGLRAKVVNVSAGTRCEGPLVGEERVEVGESDMAIANWASKWAGQIMAVRLIGKETRVEDVYSRMVLMRKASRADGIFAKKVELEDGVAAEEVAYTDEFKQGRHDFFVNLPRRVERLPDYPL